MSGMVYKKGLSALESAVEAGSREFEDALLAKVKLRGGAKVCRGRDWRWGNQDGTGVGRLKGSSSVDGWAYVIWNVGAGNRYRWGVTQGDGMAFDLLPLDPTQLDVSALSEDERAYVRTYGLLTHTPEMSDVIVKAVTAPTLEVIKIHEMANHYRNVTHDQRTAPMAIGDRVVPGPKWGFGEQGHRDGKPVVGTVVRVCSPWTVYVLWDGTQGLKDDESYEQGRSTTTNPNRMMICKTYPVDDTGVVPLSNATPRPRVRSGMSSEDFRFFKEAMERQFRVDKPAKEPAKEPTEGERLARFFATSEHEGHPQVRYIKPSGIRAVGGLPDGAPAHVRRDYCDTLVAIMENEDREPLVLRDDFDNLPDA